MRVVAILCTYNEAESLPEVISKLKQSVTGVVVVVVDDDSPDGTARVASSNGAEVLLRKNLPMGRGLAGRAGYERALELGADAILEMDADGSHDPADAPKLLAALAAADVAVGSRSGGKGGEDQRGILRQGVSAAAKLFLKLTLRLPLEDPTSGYRAILRDALKKINPSTLKAVGPEIVEEVYLRAQREGLKMVEVPIVFRPRAGGESKLTIGKLFKVLAGCVRMAFQ